MLKQYLLQIKYAISASSYCLCNFYPLQTFCQSFLKESHVLVLEALCVVWGVFCGFFFPFFLFSFFFLICFSICVRFLASTQMLHCILRFLWGNRDIWAIIFSKHQASPCYQNNNNNRKCLLSTFYVPGFMHITTLHGLMHLFLVKTL